MRLSSVSTGKTNKPGRGVGVGEAVAVGGGTGEGVKVGGTGDGIGAGVAAGAHPFAAAPMSTIPTIAIRADLSTTCLLRRSILPACPRKIRMGDAARRA